MQNIHWKAPDCWINDPNGLIWYKGQYHLFYQCFPYAPKWGRMHWGHAVSRDLVHWEEKGIALFPTKTDDRSGCYSGSAIEHDGQMHLFYTGVTYTQENPENINVPLSDLTSAQLKISSADGMTFDNFNKKTTILPPLTDPAIGSKTDTRDPKVWRGKDAWYLVLGSTVQNKGRLLFYKSDDLQNFTYCGFTEKENFGWMWECPDYFEVNGTGVALFSPMGFLNDGKRYDAVTVCMLASFEEASGTMKLADTYQFFDYGLDLYAPQSTLDKDGNRMILAWARMPEAVDGKWIGMLCMPRIVEVKDRHICFRPHPNLSNSFSKQIASPKEASRDGYRVQTMLQNGESISIGGYQIRREEDRIFTDRHAVFPKKPDFRLTAETPVIQTGTALDIYVDQNLIEVFIGDGEFVISSVVYGLSDEIQGANYILHTTNFEKDGENT